MSNIDNLMKNATGEQRKLLGRLKDCIGEEREIKEEMERVIYNYVFPYINIYDRKELDEQKKQYPFSDEDIENSAFVSDLTRQRLRDVRGRIKKTVQDAKSQGILVVNYDDLR